MKKDLFLMMLLSAISVLVVAISLDSVYAQENTTDSDTPKFFAIQHAQSGSISKINETAYSLELNDVSDKTILFSDRPERIVETESTSNYIGNWTTGDDSFAVDAPNAVLIVDESEKQSNPIIGLFNSIYDTYKKTLKYEVTPDNATSINTSTKFGQVTLFIDTGSNQGVVAEMIALGGNR